MKLKLMVVFLIFTINCSATILEDILNKMSEGSYSLISDTRKCVGFNESLVSLDLKNFNDTCINGAKFSSVLDKAAEENGRDLEDYVEDQFVSSLVIQHMRELRCAEQFTKKLSKQKLQESESEFINNVATNILRLRKVKQDVSNAALKLTKLRTGQRVCPLSLKNLKPSIHLKKSEDKYYNLCHKILTNRKGQEAIELSIPFANINGPIEELIDKFTTTKDSNQIKSMKDNLIKNLKGAYGDISKSLNQERKNLSDNLKKNGPKGFGRSERRLLMSDPRVVQKIIDSGSSRKELEQLSCRMDARYRKGADRLDVNLGVGSLLVGGLVGAAGKVGGRALVVARGATAARATGALSINSARLIKFSALSGAFSADMLASFSDTTGACFKKFNLGYKVSAVEKNGSCASSPKIEDMEKDKCVLTATLGVLGILGGVELIKFLPKKKKVARVKENSLEDEAFVSSLKNGESSEAKGFQVLVAKLEKKEALSILSSFSKGAKEEKDFLRELLSHLSSKPENIDQILLKSLSKARGGARAYEEALEIVRGSIESKWRSAAVTLNMDDKKTISLSKLEDGKDPIRESIFQFEKITKEPAFSSILDEVKGNTYAEVLLADRVRNLSKLGKTDNEIVKLINSKIKSCRKI